VSTAPTATTLQNSPPSRPSSPHWIGGRAPTADAASNTKSKNRHRDQAGYYREPKDEAEIVIEKSHQPDSEQGAYEGTDRVERLPQTIGRAPQFGWRKIANQSVAWCSPNTFTDAVGKAGHQHPPGCWRESEKRLRQRA
jgi:hypothetical protein